MGTVGCVTRKPQRRAALDANIEHSKASAANSPESTRHTKGRSQQEGGGTKEGLQANQGRTFNVNQGLLLLVVAEKVFRVGAKGLAVTEKGEEPQKDDQLGHLKTIALNTV